MATAKCTTTTTKSKTGAIPAKALRTRRTGTPNSLAVCLLKQDHREVEGWFIEYKKLEDEGENLKLFTKIATG